MNIHEYQAKSLLKKFGVAVPRGGVAYTPQEAQKVAEGLGGPVWVVKSQIHAGGRGAGRFKYNPQGKGGVRVVTSLEEVATSAAEMLGHTLVTKQTGPAGREVKRVYIEEGCDIKRELYLGMLIDRSTSRVTVMASTEGGVEIEEVAAAHPEKILKVAIDPATGMQGFHARQLAFGLGLEGKQVSSAVKFMLAMYKGFSELDASIVEINPLVVTGDGHVVALDAKMNFDDNALFRRAEIEEMRDISEEDPSETEAAKHGLNYIKLEGNIGCMVNGAGLAMATMDIIKLYGGDPANFLDVGGGATKDRVTTAFKLILSDPNVEGILVNIFGGIMRCDVIADGVVAAAREVSLHVPLVVRLEGTNVNLGKKILAESGLAILSADNLADAAEKIVKSVREAA
jgi:succinyl-CoA synthetase beta subunit